MSQLVTICCVLLAETTACEAQPEKTGQRTESPQDDPPFIVVLGVAQDAGYPQAGCEKECCQAARDDASRKRHPVCLAIVDPESRQRWLLDCTPHFPEQLHELDRVAPCERRPGLDGILLTHAHIGHYAGLMHLGREAIGATDVPVFAMPRMRSFLRTNGPWSQLVSAKNISLRDLKDGLPVRLNERLRITPFLVPHRDEYSETVGFRIDGPNHSAVYLPDIDKWERWETSIEAVIADADVAYLDGTFFANGELPNRDMSRIPHPFVVETIERLKSLPNDERAKIRFLHFNHTNPLLDPESAATRILRQSGHKAAEQGERFGL